MLDNNMKVGDIAKEAGVSEDTVRRYILRVTGKNYIAYKAGKN
jgi:DeoR/GlpR family transcriptional regulator of sugar metabolism